LAVPIVIFAAAAFDPPEDDAGLAGGELDLFDPLVPPHAATRRTMVASPRKPEARHRIDRQLPVIIPPSRWSTREGCHPH
jgi:hypothetical protein